MDNNYQSNNGYAPNQGNNPYANPYSTTPENVTYTNPYTAQQANSPYANPYVTPQGNPPYADPYAAQQGNSPYADPYATQQGNSPYADPYASPYVPVAPKKSKKGLLIGLIAGGSALLIIIIALALYFTSDSYKYGKAEDLMAEENYTEAVAIFEDLGYYENSEEKAIECNRNILYDYLEPEENGVYIISDDYKYLLTASEDERELELWVLTENDGFRLAFDMKSDKADFYYLWDSSYGNDSTTEGTCNISELTTDNSLEIDRFTGNTSHMQSLTDGSCDLACHYLPDLLDDTGLGLTPADLGFTSLD